MACVLSFIEHLEAFTSQTKVWIRSLTVTAQTLLITYEYDFSSGSIQMGDFKVFFPLYS